MAALRLRKKVWETIDDVGLREDVENMPMGIHTILSESGGTISGGQQQRILIARAISASQEQKLKRFQQVIGAIPSSTSQICDVLILFFGALMVIRGSFTPGTLIAFNALFDCFQDPIDKLIGFFEGLQTVKSNSTV